MPARVALETTLLLHGVPRDSALGLFRELSTIARSEGAIPSPVAVVAGKPVVGLSESVFCEMLAADHVPKLNTSNLGTVMGGLTSGATTVSTTMEIAAAAGIRVFATGGLGGVHRGYGQQLDISTDLIALTRFPVAVVTSGVKSILDVAATREMLETLGVPVIGYQTSEFPAFYLRRTTPALDVDARADTIGDLGRLVGRELARTSRGIVVANPVPSADELNSDEWAAWVATAAREAEEKGIAGRGWTPFMLGKVHELSHGATLRANVALVKENVRVAAQLAVAMAKNRNPCG